jgi:hypothetical protein
LARFAGSKASADLPSRGRLSKQNHHLPRSFPFDFAQGQDDSSKSGRERPAVVGCLDSLPGISSARGMDGRLL